MIIPKAYLALGGAALAVAIVAGAYWKGDRAGSARCEARWQARIVEEQNRRAAAVAEAEQEAQRQAIAHDAEIRDLEAKVDAYEAEPAQGDVCRIGADDARRLQDIR